MSVHVTKAYEKVEVYFNLFLTSDVECVSSYLHAPDTVVPVPTKYELSGP
jgi:hypothetical protein